MPRRVTVGNLAPVMFPDTFTDDMIAEEVDRQYQKFGGTVAWPPPDKPTSNWGIGAILPESAKAVIGRMAGGPTAAVGGLFGAGIKALTGEAPEWTKEAQEFAETQRRYQQQVAPGTIASGLGMAAEMAPGLAIGMIPGAQPLAAAYFAGLGGSEMERRLQETKAKDVEVSPEWERYGPLGGAAIGGASYFLFPHLAGKVGGVLQPGITNVVSGLPGRFASRFLGGAAGGGAQTAAQSGAENIEHALFDPTRTFIESAKDVAMQTGVGALLGGAMHGAIGRNVARKTAAERELDALASDRRRDYRNLTDEQLDAVEQVHQQNQDEVGQAYAERERLDRLRTKPIVPEPEAPPIETPPVMAPEPAPVTEPPRFSLAAEEAPVRPQPEQLDLPLFDTVPQPEGPGPPVTGEPRRLLIRHLNRTFNRFGLRNVGLQLEKALTTAGGAEGLWDPVTKTVAVALDHIDPATGFVGELRKGHRILSHEVWHALKKLDLVRGRDLRLLNRELGERVVPGTDETYLDWANRRYGEKYKNYDNPQEAVREEAEANLMSHFLTGAQEAPGYANILGQRVGQFFDRLGNGLRGSGFQTMDDFLSMVETGQVGQRRRNWAMPKNLFGVRMDADEEQRFALERQPNPEVEALASRYAEDEGLQRPPIGDPREPAEDYLKQIADTFQRASHTPRNPQTREAYDALIRETGKQFERLGDLKIEAWSGQGEPYKNSAETVADIGKGHLWFLPTESAYGEGAPALDKSHPMLQETGYKLADGRPLLANDVFRITHDVFGHAKSGNTFGPRGEYNAYLDHSRMYSDQAIPALASETLAQNAWVNFGPHLRRPDGSIPKRGDPDYVPPQQRPFADQKAFTVPRELLDADPNGIRYSLPEEYVAAGLDEIRTTGLDSATWKRNMARRFGMPFMDVAQKVWTKSRALRDKERAWGPLQDRMEYDPRLRLRQIDDRRIVIPTAIPGTQKVEDVVRYLGNRTATAMGAIPHDAPPEAKLGRLLELGRADIDEQMNEPYTGEHWYDTDQRQVDQDLSKPFPELAQDPI